jgi:hypothetical protein
MGGGGGGVGPFPACTIIFSKFFVCRFYFSFFIFPRSRGVVVGGGQGREVVKIFFQDVEIFSGHKKRGQKNLSGLTSVQLRFKTHFP